jgi:hypothetical protein
LNDSIRVMQNYDILSSEPNNPKPKITHLI